MSDFVQLQEDFAQGLLGEAYLRCVQVVQYRKLRLQSEVDWSAVYAVGRNGRAGCGVLVEMPTFEVWHPNMAGPVGTCVISCVVLEEPNLNLEPATGTLLSAEAVSQFILASSHQWEIGGVGVVSAVREAIRGLWRTEDLHGVVGQGSLRDAIWDAQRFQGLVAYRVKLQLQAAAVPWTRVAQPVLARDGANLILSCATSQSAIYFTTDGSYPGPGNPQARLYAGPFQTTGPTLRFAAYADGQVRSHVGQVENPARGNP